MPLAKIWARENKIGKFTARLSTYILLYFPPRKQENYSDKKPNFKFMKE